MDPQRVLEIATRIAAGHGDPEPGSVQSVTRTYGRAKQVVFASSDHARPAHTPVLVIQMRGDFVGLRYPARRPPPTGQVLTVLVDAQTGRVLGVRITRRVPDLAPLGRAESLKLPE
jgi:hypothetical protein